MSPEGRAGAPDPYLSSQLIPYLGSKRALLPLLRATFARVSADAGLGSGAVFLDPFCGSGSVSRLARSLGMKVAANDAEEYAALLARVWIGSGPADLEAAFRPHGGAKAAFAALDALHPSRGGAPADPASRGGFARSYAPASTAGADWRVERLFWTAENAAFIDRVLAALDAGGFGGLARDAALGALVLEAATHANTSGVFKAFHKGFGGHSGDALGRILAPMSLEVPLLVAGPSAEIGRGDAAAFARGRPAGIAYLDPPYNQHQYGSNYHLLNAVARGRVGDPGDRLGADGTLASKAGISPDWKATRSDFCSRAKAGAAYRVLVDSIDAAAIVASANTEGTVGLEELVDLLGARGPVRVEISDYVRYRGGRQSAERLVRNHELVVVAEAWRGESLGRPGAGERRRLSLELAFRKALSRPLVPSLVAGQPGAGRDRLAIGPAALGLSTRLELGVRPLDPVDAAGLADGELAEAVAILESCAVPDNRGLVEVWAGVLGDPARADAEAARAGRYALAALRRLAHRKHRGAFGHAAAVLATAAVRRGGAMAVRTAAGIEELEALLAKREAGRSR